MGREMNYDRPVPIAEGIWWIGVHDPQDDLQCNAYLVTEGDKALVIDGGSRPEFASVMMKLLQTGISPCQVEGLVYQHYDPDLCGSIPNFIDLCENPDLKIISRRSNNLFLRYYFEKKHHGLLFDLENSDWSLNLEGRILRFIPTPFAHSSGSFVTFDERTGVMFSSDLFSSFSRSWRLFQTLEEDCFACTQHEACPNGKPYCFIPDFIRFHQQVMPSNKAVNRAAETIASFNPSIIAPQHGSILRNSRDISHLLGMLSNMEKIGIDGDAL